MSDALSSIPDSQTVPVEVKDLALVPSSDTSEPFLRLYLPEMSVLLPVQQLGEVLSIPIGQIVPIPHMPAWVMGVYNWRGEILWMIDLGHLCGLTPWYEQKTHGSTHSAIVLQVHSRKTLPTSRKSQILGLVVNQVGDLEWCDPEVIRSVAPSTLMPELAPLLRGYWWQPEGDMLTILERPFLRCD